MKLLLKLNLKTMCSCIQNMNILRSSRNIRNIPLKSVRTYSSNLENVGYPRKLFSGIQPTGDIHLGNYLGAVKPWIQMQNDGEDITLCIVNLHAITVPQDPKVLSKSILQMTATLLGCGIDVEKTVLYVQSDLPQHSEMFWHVACISTMARLAHLPQYKEKTANLKDIPLGLFIYPVLQAADILLFKATHVPVGEDQIQHLQLCQDLARMFNNRYGRTFPIPHSVIGDGNVAKIRSLREPTKKMSKSDVNPKSRICLTDTPDEITVKVKKAITDFTSQISYDPENRPGVSNLISMYSAVTGKSVKDILEETATLDTLKFKYLVADALIQHLNPIRRRINEFIGEPGYVLEVLRNGAEKAGETAEKTLREVKTKTGFSVASKVGEILKIKV